MRLRFFAFRLFTLLIASIATTDVFANTKDLSVKIPLNDWASQRIISKVIGHQIEQAGYQVDYVEIDSDDQWRAIAKGLIHFQLEVWEPDANSLFYKLIAQKELDLIEKYDTQVIEEWWYPHYVKDQCPGLPDWKALNKCSILFATKKSGKKGVFHTGPWTYEDGQLIRALDLNFVLERHANDRSLWRLLKDKVRRKKPVLLMNWSPNWVEAEIPGEFVEFPAYEAPCYRDPTWGVNPSMTHDCGNRRNRWIGKAIWSKFSKTFPCVDRYLKAIKLNNHLIADASAWVEARNNDEQLAITFWTNKNKNLLDFWQTFLCPANKTTPTND